MERVSINSTTQRIYFDGILEFDDFLKEKTYLAQDQEIKLTKNHIREIAQHERDHFRKAKDLGYSPRYFINREPYWGFITFIGVNVKNLLLEDFIKIALAPKNPSSIDKRLVSLAEFQLQQRKNNKIFIQKSLRKYKKI